jgi:hypothetical protein
LTRCGTGRIAALPRIEAVLQDDPAQLWVLRGNHRAIAFYERNGFAADGVVFIDQSEPSLVELRMVR